MISLSLDPEAVAGQSSSYHDDANNDPFAQNLVYQDARLIAPQVGNNQNDRTVFTHNIDTDTNYFLQDGFYFKAGVGHVAWTTTYYGFSLTDFVGIPYISGHSYQFSIYHPVANPGLWYLGAQDLNTGTYVTVSDYHLDIPVGSKLKYSCNTGVFFENFNTNANWYSGFTMDVQATFAHDSTDPYTGYKAWGGDRKCIFDSWGNPQDNSGKITGSLAGYGTATWHLEKLLLGH